MEAQVFQFPRTEAAPSTDRTPREQECGGLVEFSAYSNLFRTVQKLRYDGEQPDLLCICLLLTDRGAKQLQRSRRVEDVFTAPRTRFGGTEYPTEDFWHDLETSTIVVHVRIPKAELLALGKTRFEFSWRGTHGRRDLDCPVRYRGKKKGRDL